MQINNVYNADCMDFLKELPDDCIDCVITDPPYIVSTSGGGIYNQADKRYVKELESMKNGFSEQILDELCRVMKKINIYIFCSQKQIIPLLEYFVNEKKCNYNIISWHKTNPIPNCGNKYLTDTEYVLFFREKGVKLYGNFETKKTYYITPLNIKDKKKYNHPTVKNLDMVKNFVINSTQENDIVLDPFIGSGTTAVACVSLDRKYIGCEINERYYRIAENRIKEVTNEY